MNKTMASLKNQNNYNKINGSSTMLSDRQAE